MVFKVSIITLFPSMFPGPLSESLLGKGLKNKIWSLETIDLRNFAENKHKNVDSPPYGGGAGMIIKREVIDLALENLNNKDIPKVYLTPRGTPFKQKRALELSKNNGLV